MHNFRRKSLKETPHARTAPAAHFRALGIVTLLVLLIPALASAKAVRVHGVVLAVQRKSGEVIVRHQAFDGMPGMTMPFRVAPRASLGKLHEGAEIDASLDTAHDPWTLTNISILATQSAAPAVSIRHVQPLRVGDVIPDPPFVDQRGAPFRFSSLSGQDVVLSFVYTRCRDPRMCPLISSKFYALQRKSGSRRIHLVEVTLDPAFDRPPILERFAKAFRADPRRWTMAVGAVEPTLDFAARFGVTAFPDPKIGLIHSVDTVLIGPDGRIRNMIADNAWQPEGILADIDASRGESSNPMERLNLWLSKEAVALCGNSVAGFSGLADLLIVMAIFGAGGYLMFRLARLVFARGI